MSGSAAQKALTRAIAAHPHKDGRVWQLRTVVSDGNATSLSVGSASFTDTLIDPVVQEITEREAIYIGKNIRAGDLRLILSGETPITTNSVLICDGEKVDIVRVVESYQHGTVQQYKVYVRRRPENTDIS